MGKGKFKMVIPEMKSRIKSLVPDYFRKQVKKTIAASEDRLVVFYGKPCLKVSLAPEPVHDEILVVLIINEYGAVWGE